MTKEQALRILKHFNRWSRDGLGVWELEYTPKQIGVAIDVAIKNLGKDK